MASTATLLDLEEDLVPLSLAPVDQSSSDRVLMAQFRRGEQDAAHHLYMRYAERLRRLAEQFCNARYESRFDAEDVVQSVFRDFFQGVQKERYDSTPEGDIWGLLTVLALNKVRGKIKHHQAAKRCVDRTCAMPEELESAPLSSDENAMAFLKMVLDEQLASYPEMYRQVIRWRMEGYEIGEIAGLSGRSTRTVERILYEFRTKLEESS